MSRDDLLLIFRQGTLIRGKPRTECDDHGVVRVVEEGKILGKGFFECDLIAQGFDRRDLKMLVAHGKLVKVTTTHNKAWRNTYVMPMTEEELAS